MAGKRVVTTEKVARKFRQIMLDEDTIQRLKSLAAKENTSVSDYVRKLSYNLSNGTPAPLSPIESKLDKIAESIKDLQGVVSIYRESKSGKLTEVKPMKDPDVPDVSDLLKQAKLTAPKGPETPEQEADRLKKVTQVLENAPRAYFPSVVWGELQAFDEDHPVAEGEADCGFYHRDPDGQWHFIQERADAADKEDAARKDALIEKWDADDAAAAARKSHKAKKQ